MMEFSVKQQIIHLALYIGIGLTVGILFDLFRSVRVRYKKQQVLTHCLDAIFSLLCGGYLFWCFYQLDGLMLGVFNIMGALSGLLLYFLCFCSAFRLTFEKSLDFFIKIFKILLYPFKILCKISIRILFFLQKRLHRFYRMLAKPVGRWKHDVVRKAGMLRRRIRKN